MVGPRGAMGDKQSKCMKHLMFFNCFLMHFDVRVAMHAWKCMFVAYFWCLFWCMRKSQACFRNIFCIVFARKLHAFGTVNCKAPSFCVVRSSIILYVWLPSYCWRRFATLSQTVCDRAVRRKSHRADQSLIKKSVCAGFIHEKRRIEVYSALLMHFLIC